MADMKVNKTSSVSGSSSARKTKSSPAGGAAFSDALRDTAGVESASAAQSVSGVSPVGAILSVQEVSDSTDGRSRGLMLEYGDDLLDRLEDIRLGLLLGVVSKDKLADLAQQMRQKRQGVDDPKLLDIINEIELRSEVEIAKLTRNL